MHTFPLKNETYEIIGLCMEVQKTLGFGFSEAVYKDAIEIELRGMELPYFKEKELEVEYKGEKLKHKFFADFICYDSVIVEIKSTDKGITDDYIAQTLNYLRVSGNSVGLIINFGKRKLEYKRLIL
ncbi:MAG TPA: GxxExxY protein [Chitinophagaceae bacterium]|nr:GxxExxY protein [Chitinophagaceae bacterium]HNU13326.1 GxxExxY protein [Chitinophagaceae bacterium]